MDVGLREVTAETVRAICRLEVHEQQRAFVAPVAVSIARAHFEPSAVLRAAYAGDQPVGFMLWRDGGQPKTAFLWRFMIDKAHQKKGLGRTALLLAFAELKAQGFGQLTTSVVLGTHDPLDFYLSLGFVETNETTGNGERILQKVL
jgi:diamine N-acetyltransferase